MTLGASGYETSGALSFFPPHDFSLHRQKCGLREESTDTNLATSFAEKYQQICGLLGLHEISVFTAHSVMLIRFEPLFALYVLHRSELPLRRFSSAGTRKGGVFACVRG